MRRFTAILLIFAIISGIGTTIPIRDMTASASAADSESAAVTSASESATEVCPSCAARKLWRVVRFSVRNADGSTTVTERRSVKTDSNGQQLTQCRGFNQITVTVIPSPIPEPPQFYDTDTFPTIRIQAQHATPEGADNAVAPFTVRTLWHDSVITVEGTGDRFLDFEGVNGRIRGRGRSSWTEGMASQKRSLRLRLDRDRYMLGSQTAHRNWVLIANQFDHSLLRNYFAYHLGRQLDAMEWAPYAAFVHLYVNGEYMGVYMLADERTNSPGRTQVTHDENPALCEYFLEMDHRHQMDGGEEWIDYVRVNSSRALDNPLGQSLPGFTFPGQPVVERDQLYEVRYPAAQHLTHEHMLYVRNYIDSVGRAIRSRDFARISALVDIPSMVDFVIVQELFMNPDIAHGSQFMTIKGQGADRRLHMGPIWDFDIAAGNINSTAFGGGFPGWGPQPPPTEPAHTGWYLQNEFYWYRHLMEVPEFRAALRARWNEVGRPAVERTAQHVTRLSEDYRDCFERNFERHDVLGRNVWMTHPWVVQNLTTFPAQANYVISFLRRRSDWIVQNV